MDELTDDQGAEIRDDLRALEAELVELVALSRDATRPVELDQAAMGRVSRIDAIQQQQMATAGRKRHEARLRLVRAALANDDYGACRRCEEPIGYGRLKARPESPHCVDCAGVLEGRR